MSSSDHIPPTFCPPSLLRFTPRRLLALDVIAALLLVFSAVHWAFLDHHNRSWPVFVLAALAGLAIGIRRRSPMTALVLMTVTIGLATAFGENWAIDPFVAIPIYQVASTFDLRRSITNFVVSAAALTVASASAALSHRPAGAGVILIVVAGWFIGESVRVRRTFMSGIAEQAAQRQREVVERAERSIAEERLLIARELHDVVAHTLSVIAVQSGVGRHVIDSQPEEAKKALAAIETTSRSALEELRRMLGVLRRDDQPAAPLEPAHDLSALEVLIEPVRAAGFNVDLDLRGAIAGSLSPAAELSLYRIIQEALTNVVKHAGSPARVRVEIREETNALVLEVSDTGRGMPPAGTSQLGDLGEPIHHGIVGMRERVALFDGTFSAEPRPEGGFRVLACFPLDSLLPT
jgi:signal transduction histidine kinase